MNPDKNLKELIGSLSENLPPIRRIPHPLQRAAICFAASAAYLIFTIFLLGIRHDWADKLTDPAYLFEIGLGLSIWISAILAAGWMCIPDMRGREWMTGIPFGFLAILGVWVLYRITAEGLPLIDLHWEHCCEDGLTMAALPLLLIVTMVRGGTTTRPFLMGAINALAIGAAGWTGLRFTCPMDDLGHGVIYHLIPFVVIGSILSMLSTRLFRW